MVLALARPEVHAASPRCGPSASVQTSSSARSARRASERLVRDALGERAAPAVIARIVDRAGGNPFYLEELVRAVAGGRGDAFPDSVLGTVEARLDAEGSEAKRVLRAATSGSAVGARYAAKDRILTLESQIDINVVGPNACRITAARAIITKDPRNIELIQAHRCAAINR